MASQRLSVWWKRSRACSAARLGDGYDDYDYDSGDLDCADIGEEIEIDGDDPNGPDADEDGIGCEGW